MIHFLWQFLPIKHWRKIDWSGRCWHQRVTGCAMAAVCRLCIWQNLELVHIPALPLLMDEMKNDVPLLLFVGGLLFLLQRDDSGNDLLVPRSSASPVSHCCCLKTSGAPVTLSVTAEHCSIASSSKCVFLIDLYPWDVITPIPTPFPIEQILTVYFELIKMLLI